MRTSPTILVLLQFCLLSGVAHADMLKRQEPVYAEAVLAYNAKKFDEAIRILDQLLQESPGLIDFLELKALALKTAKNDSESAKTYEALIEAKKDAPPAETAPYHFELGVIRFRGKSFPDARVHFAKSLEARFNRAASAFFLGMTSYQDSFHSEAVDYFEIAATSEVPELKAPALFYLAQSAMKLGDSGIALSNFSKAKAVTEDRTDEVSKSIHDACVQILTPLDQSKRFANLSYSLAYDSNVQALPNSLDGTLATNRSSVKNLFQAGYGLMTSPTRDYQWVPSYRASYNYNFDRKTLLGEFLNQNLSVYLNHKPLEQSAWGLKAETSYTFQNQFDDDTETHSTFRIFSWTGSLGGYYRTPLSKTWNVTFDASFGPQKYFGDQNGSTPEASWRTGSQLALSTSFSRTSLGPYLNPVLFLGYLKNNTHGMQFYSEGASITAVNKLILSPSLQGTLALNYSPTFYSRSAEGRVDHNASFSAEIQKQLNPKWTFLSDASVGYNSSTNANLYEYRRWTVSAGLNYSFY